MASTTWACTLSTSSSVGLSHCFTAATACCQRSQDPQTQPACRRHYCYWAVFASCVSDTLPCGGQSVARNAELDLSPLMGWPATLRMSCWRGSGRYQRPHAKPTSMRCLRMKLSGPQKLRICDWPRWYTGQMSAPHCMALSPVVLHSPGRVWAGSEHGYDPGLGGPLLPLYLHGSESSRCPRPASWQAGLRRVHGHTRFSIGNTRLTGRSNP